MYEKPTFSIGCFAIIREGQKVLLTHRTDKDLWVLPGGAMEYGESPQGAVVREVLEETGLNVDIETFFGIYSKPKENDLVLLFTCRKTSGELTLNEEADRLEYFAFEEIPPNTNPKHVGRIKDVMTQEGVTSFITTQD